MEIDFQTLGLLLLFGYGLWFTYNRGFGHGYDQGSFDVITQMEQQGIKVEVIADDLSGD